MKTLNIAAVAEVMRVRSASKFRLAGTALSIVALCVGCAIAPAASGATSGSVVAVLDGPYGPMLIAGSGPSAGTALYMITSDNGTTFGCTTMKQTILGMPYVCTGPSTSTEAEWPAYTTTGTPVAGPGVNSSLLS